jgi:hypothetical protein
VFAHFHAFSGQLCKTDINKADLSRLKFVGKIHFVGYWLIIMATMLEGQIDCFICSLSFLWQ